MSTKVVKKGYLKNKNTGEVKSFLYNPTGFTDDQAINFSEISSPGSSYPKFQYVNTGSRSFSLELFLANTSKSTVQEYLNFIDKFVPKGARFNKPPVLIFAMGTDVRECILTGVSRNFTDFNANLDKTRATVTLSLVELH